MKPSIRKRDGRWVLTRPPFGFSSGPEVTWHGSWKAARQALLGSAPAARRVTDGTGRRPATHVASTSRTQDPHRLVVTPGGHMTDLPKMITLSVPLGPGRSDFLVSLPVYNWEPPTLDATEAAIRHIAEQAISKLRDETWLWEEDA